MQILKAEDDEVTLELGVAAVLSPWYCSGRPVPFAVKMVLWMQNGNGGKPACSSRWRKGRAEHPARGVRPASRRLDGGGAVPQATNRRRRHDGGPKGGDSPEQLQRTLVLLET
jgi:hypothetical protein